MKTNQNVYGNITEIIRREMALFGVNYGLEAEAGQLAAHVIFIVNKALECAYSAGLSHANLINMYANSDHNSSMNEDEEEFDTGLTDEEIASIFADFIKADPDDDEF